MPEDHKPTIDERLKALIMSLELSNRDLQDLKTSVQGLNLSVQQDAENIRALARIAEIHERRPTGLEDSQ